MKMINGTVPLIKENWQKQVKVPQENWQKYTKVPQENWQNIWKFVQKSVNRYEKKVI